MGCSSLNISSKSPAVLCCLLHPSLIFINPFFKMRLPFCTLLLLHIYIISFLSIQVDSEPATTFTNKESGEHATFPENSEIKALLDYESGLIFYKDKSISACLVERIPESILDHSENDTLPTFTIPILSEELCIGRENELLQTEPLMISEPGLLFCNGLAIVDLKKLSTVNSQVPKKFTYKSRHVRRRRQSNGYYRTSVPAGDSRAQSNWNSPDQASQAQVQGQVFGSGFFSGQAQSQNGGISQSQVQLSGVGIRGQIASSSGNAQAQLSLGTGGGSGQAAGLGDGPSSSQVQVTLGNQGEESMASASSTSGGARAGYGGTSGMGGVPVGNRGNAYPTGLRNGRSPGYGYSPGNRLFDESGSSGASQLPYGGGGGLNGGGSQPVQYGQGAYGQGAYGQGAYGHGSGLIDQTGTPGYLQGGHQGVPSTTQVGRSQPVQYGQGAYGHGSGLIDQTRTPGYLQGVHQGIPSTNQAGEGPTSTSYIPSGDQRVGSGVDGRTFATGAQGTGSIGIGSRDRQQSSNGIDPGPGQGGGVPSPLYGSGGLPSPSINGRPGKGYLDASGLHGGRLPGQNGDISGTIDPNIRSGILDGLSPGQSTHMGSETYQRTGEVPRGTGGNGYYGGGSTSSYGSSPSRRNGGGHMRRTGAELQPNAQSHTPGAHATTYGHGIGQAQAQTVYFGSVGNGQYAPIRYIQSSHPSGDDSRRFQDQQVGVGSPNQRGSQFPQNGASNLGTGTYGGTGQLGATSNGHYRNGIQNGYATRTHGNGGAVQSPGGQQPVRNGGGIAYPRGSGIYQPGGSGDSPPFRGTQTSAGENVGYQSGQTGSGPGIGTGVPSSQLPSGHTNGFVGGQPQTGSQSSQYGIGGVISPQNGYRQTFPSPAATNGHSTPGHDDGIRHRQQQPVSPSVINEQTRNQINGHGHPIAPTTATSTQQNGAGRMSQIPGTSGSQDGFSPSYGISRPSQEDPDGRKCTIITFSCTIVVESNGRAKICRPNAVRMNDNGNGRNAPGGNGGSGSNICCC